MTPVDKEIPVGNVGKLDLSLVGPKAVVSFTAEIPQTGTSVAISVTEDGTVLLNKAKIALENALPSGLTPAIEGAFDLIIAEINKLAPSA